MPDPQDIVDIEGLSNPAADLAAAHASATPTRNWLGVFFKCCHTYGRMYRLPSAPRYTGRCPKCLSEVTATVGQGGTNQRIFFAE